MSLGWRVPAGLDTGAAAGVATADDGVGVAAGCEEADSLFCLSSAMLCSLSLSLKLPISEVLREGDQAEGSSTERVGEAGADTSTEGTGSGRARFLLLAPSRPMRLSDSSTIVSGLGASLESCLKRRGKPWRLESSERSSDSCGGKGFAAEDTELSQSSDMEACIRILSSVAALGAAAAVVVLLVAEAQGQRAGNADRSAAMGFGTIATGAGAAGEASMGCSARGMGATGAAGVGAGADAAEVLPSQGHTEGRLPTTLTGRGPEGGRVRGGAASACAFAFEAPAELLDADLGLASALPCLRRVGL